MISRYTRPEMGALWTEESEFRAMLDVEIYACEIMAELGEIPKEAVPVIREKADFTIERIKEIERETRHDILAFTQALAENVGPEGKYIHKGLTSSDVKDTALGYLMMKSCDLILKGLQNLDQALLKQAITHRKTPQMGRTHGVHAEPTTFGLKCLLWLSEVRRDIRRMEQARETVAVGKISGAVGTYSNISPKVEEYVCEKMGLKAAMISTQIIQRDRHAEYFTTLAIVAATLEKIALEIRHLQRTEVREAEEFFHAGQKGSSAMPHKRNPITCERICGLARLVRSNAQAALENVALWHERDISHSSVERVILPDSSITVDYMLHLTTGLVDKLLVY
nr:adenylosuccinate lyase [Negativicutes bacterium]